jgi:site-specific recombinase XerD
MSIYLCRSTASLIARSPARPELEAFERWLLSERYSPLATERHLRRLVYVAPRLPGIAIGATFSAAQLAAVFGRERSPQSRLFCFAGTRRAYERYLRAAGRLVPEPRRPYDDVTEQYATYLIEVRGLSESARIHHAHEVDGFLYRGLRRGRTLRGVTRIDVERYIELRSREVSRHSMQHVVANLRAFLRFAHDQGLVAERLDGLDTPRTYRGELPPRAIPWDTVQALLASIDRTSRCGRRDLCMLHLIAHYGLRPSEVVGLRLDSIDWRTSVVTVIQSKTRSTLKLPLAAPTIDLLRDYLEERLGCNTVAPQLFLRARCPHVPLQRTVLGDVFKRRLELAGITGYRKHVYRLRHTVAMRLLGRGVGVKAIGDVLGHHSLSGTCAYLRLDLATLRQVALDVPHRGTTMESDHA